MFVSSHWNDIRLTVNLVGLVVEVSPGTVQVFALIVEALKASTGSKIFKNVNIVVQN